MKHWGKRRIAFILAALMLFVSIPFSAKAEDEERERLINGEIINVTTGAGMDGVKVGHEGKWGRGRLL